MLLAIAAIRSSVFVGVGGSECSVDGHGHFSLEQTRRKLLVGKSRGTTSAASAAGCSVIVSPSHRIIQIGQSRSVSQLRREPHAHSVHLLRHQIRERFLPLGKYRRIASLGAEYGVRRPGCWCRELGGRARNDKLSVQASAGYSSTRQLKPRRLTLV